MSDFQKLTPGTLSARPTSKKDNGSSWRDIVSESDFGKDYGPFYVGEALKEHAPVFIAAPDMQAALECVAALDMDEEEGAEVLRRHGAPEAPEMDAHAEDGQEAELAAYEKTLRAWISNKVRAALTLSKQEVE